LQFSPNSIAENFPKLLVGNTTSIIVAISNNIDLKTGRQIITFVFSGQRNQNVSENWAASRQKWKECTDADASPFKTAAEQLITKTTDDQTLYFEE